MNVLCIDFGLRRVGLAVGSPESGVAFTRDVLLNEDGLFVKLKSFIDAEGIEKILVGMPYKRDGSDGDIQAFLQDFVEELKRRFSLPVELIDERYTSKIAAEKLHMVGMKARDQKGILDSVAAQVMLQEWLEGRGK